MQRDTKEFISETIGLACEFVVFATGMLAVAMATWCLAVELSRTGLLLFPETKAAEPVINMELDNAGDSELANIKFANAVDRFTGWSNLSMDEQAVRVKLAGLIVEEVGKMTPKNPITGGFMHSFLRQMGVQMQIQAMYHLDEISGDPMLAAAQGFLVGL